MNATTGKESRATPPRGTQMVGRSDAMRRMRWLLARYADCDLPVLIEGETGTGKELAARELHYASCRHAGPFVPINCGALPDTLFEAELFGHRKGAFTDARSTEPGLVDFARGGTLFLDEVDSLSPKAQVSLLRLLQNGEFRAVGERGLRIADVRVVAATNALLLHAVEAGSFRRDLYYRLDPLHLQMPPLRDRGGDLALLARHLLDDAAHRLGLPLRRWTDQALHALAGHRWPGNVRELENVALRACMRAETEDVGLAELALAEPRIWGDAAGAAEMQDGPPLGFSAAKQHAIQLFERDYLTSLMERAGGNVSRAAQLSCTERRQLGKLLKRHGIAHYGSSFEQERQFVETA